MFGLMKSGPRLPYCGTCKTLGAKYGHGTRLLLNHDTAFLAEVLLDLGGVPLPGAAYRSFNCLTLPGKNENIPVVLQYAAAVTVALAYFRIADHRRDATEHGQNSNGHSRIVLFPATTSRRRNNFARGDSLWTKCVRFSRRRPSAKPILNRSPAWRSPRCWPRR